MIRRMIGIAAAMCVGRYASTRTFPKQNFQDDRMERTLKSDFDGDQNRAGNMDKTWKRVWKCLKTNLCIRYLSVYTYMISEWYRVFERRNLNCRDKFLCGIKKGTDFVRLTRITMSFLKNGLWGMRVE